MAPPTKTSVMLVSGEYFDYLAPDSSVITLDVLEHGLDVPRFNNQTIRKITVLEHSLRVRRIAVALWDGPDTDLDDLQIWALLHDAHEALVPWGDCIGPCKTKWMSEAESFVDEAMLKASGVHGLSSRVVRMVTIADAIALYFEAMLWMPGAIDWAFDTVNWLDICWGACCATPAIERFMPLIAPRPGECWRTEVEALIGKHRAA